MLTFTRKIRPSKPAPPGECPCGAEAYATPWEADVPLCRPHTRMWLDSPWKVIVDKVIEEDSGTEAARAEVIRRCVDRFVSNIRRKPSIWTRIATAWRVFRGRP